MLTPDKLPRVRGKYRFNAELANTSWFQVGGPAEVLYKPEDLNDLQLFLRELHGNIPVTVLGACSNVIIRDGGIAGVVIKLGRAFAGIEVIADVSERTLPLPSGEGARGRVPFEGTPSLTLPPEGGGNKMTPAFLRCGAAALDMNVAQYAAQQGITGLEFLSGIPGSIGGALAMNAGAYEREIKDVLVACEGVDRQGKPCRFNLADMGFGYRKNGLPEGIIFIRALLKGSAGKKEEIVARMRDIAEKRESTQPIRTRTGGSTFANPEGGKAWELIDSVGGRGLTIGGAKVSEKHCNFLENTGKATASELEQLGEELVKRVKEKHGVELRWEIKRIGKKP